MEQVAAIRLSVPTPADMRAVGRDLARLSRAGDLLILSGALGAGKTLLTQGIGEGLGVTSVITSPTFVICRRHAGTGGQPGLLHADAYRLTSADEIDDLDLESDMADSVTVIEWGRGLADHLSPDRLEIEISLSANPDDDTREVLVTPVGRRWDHLVPSWERIVNQDMEGGLVRDPALTPTGDNDV